MAPAITFIKFWVLDVHYFPLQYCENTVKNVGCCWFSHNNIFVFFVMMLFVTKISLFVFLLCFSCPLWRSHGCRRYLLPTHPHTRCRFSTSAKNIFQAFQILLHFGGRGRRLQTNWNILYHGTLVLSLCLVIVPSHLLHSGLSCACSINEVLASDSYFPK